MNKFFYLLFVIAVFSVNALAIEYCVPSAFKRLHAKEDQILSQVNIKIDELNKVWKESYAQINFSHKTTTPQEVGNAMSAFESERRNQLIDSYIISLTSQEKVLSNTGYDLMFSRNHLQVLSKSWEEVAEACLENEDDPNYSTAQQNASNIRAQAEQVEKMLKTTREMQQSYSREIAFFKQVKKIFQDTSSCP